MMLDDLPIELLLLVTSHLSTPDYGAVRLSCKAIEAACHDSWAQEFFTTRQFSLQMFSLSVLLDIAKHDRLGRRMKRLIIGTDMIDPDVNLDAVDEPSDTSQPGDSIDPPDPLLTRRMQSYRDYYIDQSHAQILGSEVQMLSDAVRRLPNLTNIEVRNYESSFQGGRRRDGVPWKSYGWSKLYNDTGMQMILRSTESSIPNAITMYSDCCRKVLAASVECQQLRQFVVHLRHSPSRLMQRVGSIHSLTGRAFWIPEHAQARYEKALHQLETLMITIGTNHYENMELGSSKDLLRFLSLTPNLKYLRLNEYYEGSRVHRDPFDGSQYLDLVAEKVPSLEVLELGAMAMTIESLSQLKTFSSLQKLSFFSIDLVDGSWEAVLRTIATTVPSLRTLTSACARQHVPMSDGMHRSARVAFKKDATSEVTSMEHEAWKTPTTITDKRQRDFIAATEEAIQLLYIDDDTFRKANQPAHDSATEHIHGQGFAPNEEDSDNYESEDESGFMSNGSDEEDSDEAADDVQV